MAPVSCTRITNNVSCRAALEREYLFAIPGARLGRESLLIAQGQSGFTLFHFPSDEQFALGARYHRARYFDFVSLGNGESFLFEKLRRAESNIDRSFCGLQREMNAALRSETRLHRFHFLDGALQSRHGHRVMQRGLAPAPHLRSAVFGEQRRAHARAGGSPGSRKGCHPRQPKQESRPALLNASLLVPCCFPKGPRIRAVLHSERLSSWPIARYCSCHRFVSRSMLRASVRTRSPFGFALSNSPFISRKRVEMRC